MDNRTEIIDALVAAGCEVFTPDLPHFPQGVPKYNILGWLFQHCMETGQVISRFEQDQVVMRVQARANRVADAGMGHFLTVGELRDKLTRLPENMPVTYQRIEDVYFEKHSWKSVPLTWETHDAHERDIAYLQENPGPMTALVEVNGKLMVRNLSEYIPAFGAYVTEDDEGRSYFCIHAHY
jgi:hypothetical protein